MPTREQIRKMRELAQDAYVDRLNRENLALGRMTFDVDVRHREEANKEETKDAKN